MREPDSRETTSWRRISWDGISFPVPDTWSLSRFRLGPHNPGIALDDRSALRLELDWTRLRRPVDVARVMPRYSKMADALKRGASGEKKVEGLPAGWTAFIYSTESGNSLAVGFWVSPRNDFMCLLRLHCGPDSRGETAPARMLKQVTSGFSYVDSGLVSWEVYDVSFSLDRDFGLCEAKFDAGRKFMMFEWKHRLLRIWQLSLADVALRNKSLAEFSSGFLDTAGIPSIRFLPDGDRNIVCRRDGFGMMTSPGEIGRCCFRHRAACVHLPDRNAVLIVEFNFRGVADAGGLASRFSCPDPDLVSRLAV